MKEVLKTAYTLWCLLLLMTFCFLTCVSFLAMLYGWGTDQDSMIFASMLCVVTFGWGMLRYSKIFTDRVEHTKKAALNWDEEDSDEEDQAGH